MGYAPISYNGGFITLSYLISVVGALTTLELLRRVTSPRGLLNWVLLVSSAFSMGGVSIWCMHYIGNRAITLYAGQRGLQLSYGAGYTVLSFFMPVIVLLLAYVSIGGVENARTWRLAIGGTFAGAAICGMHYLGQLSISNYHSTYSVGHVIGSVIIAIAATNVALILFFKLRQKWDDAFWKRAGCALVLAGAVSGMHWTAATGTSYTLIQGTEDMASARWTAIVVAVISFLSCIFLMGFAFEAGRRARKSRNRAQKVVLASATFDPDGKVMLTTDGMFPCREITDSYHERSFDDRFDNAHPVFLWIFRASVHWDCIRSLIPGMKTHLKATVSESSADYSLLFREMFCVNAQALADSLGLPLETLGVAYDHILETGVMRPQRVRSLSGGKRVIADYGRGQFLFLVKHASRAEAAHLTSSGYRFAVLGNVVGTVARAMQIDRDEAHHQLERMANYHGPQHYFSPGVHIGFCGMRPILQRGFNIVVREGQTHSIPSLQLPVDSLNAEQVAFIRNFAGNTVNEILTELRVPQPPRMDYDMQIFRAQFHGAIVSLSQEVKEPSFMDAVLLPQMFELSVNDNSPHKASLTATCIILRSIIPIHSSSDDLKSTNLIYSPLSLFLTQQHVLEKTSRATFARDSRKEFLSLFESTVNFSNPTPRSSTCPSRWNVFKRKSFVEGGDSSWQLGQYLEEGTSHPGLGTEVAIHTGPEALQLTLPQPLDESFRPRDSSSSNANAIVVQKSVTVTVQDRDHVDSKRGSTLSTASTADFEKPVLASDDTIWADICFKGIMKG